MWPFRSNIFVTVTSIEPNYKGQAHFVVSSSATGQSLFDQVTKTIGLRETWFFGLQYIDNSGYRTWLELDRKIMSQHLPKIKYNEDNQLKFELRVKYYPWDVTDDIIQDMTLRLFYLQIRDSILSDEIYCPPDTCVLLASYALQAQFGNCTSESELPITIDKLIPARVLEQINYNEEQWIDQLTRWWSEYTDQSHEDSMREYLKIAQDLEMFGVDYYPVRNKKGTNLLLGFDSKGLNLYETIDRLTPKIGFRWSEIRLISIKKKKFFIYPTADSVSKFICYIDRKRIARRMLEQANGNYKLYLLIRDSDLIEIQQMRAEANYQREIREKERKQLRVEMVAREKAEKIQFEYEQQFKELKDKVKLEQIGLLEAQKQIRFLEEQLNQAKNDVDMKISTCDQRLQNCTKNKNLTSIIINEVTLTDNEIKDQEFKLVEKDIERIVTKLDEVEHKAELSKLFVQQQLEDLCQDLEMNTNHEKSTINDELHRENVKLGRNKYKTLKEIRRGNTLRRIEYFENM